MKMFEALVTLDERKRIGVRNKSKKKPPLWLEEIS